MKVALWRKICAVLVFAVISQIGGSVVFLWNAFSPEYARAYPGDITYTILQAVSGPIAVILAAAAMTSIVQNCCHIFCAVVLGIYAALAIASTIFSCVARRGADVVDISVALSAVTAIAFAVVFVKESVARRTKR